MSLLLWMAASVSSSCAVCVLSFRISTTSPSTPNFKYTADADDKNAFDIEAFLSARLKLKPNEVCDVYEVDTKGA